MTKLKMPSVELLAPVGDWSMLVAAINAGADAVYFGISGFNMRAAAHNFKLNEAKKVVSYCHQHKVKAYCTVNVIIFESELSKLDKLLRTLKQAKIDAVICWDMAVVSKCAQLKIPVHLSTQASVSNSAAAQLWKKQGVQRIVLARECSLQDIRKIKSRSKLEIEVFVHGARCISLSGRCFMSYELFGKSANRGECWQPCRREYKVTDEENKELIMENNFVMSAKDLCALPLLPQIINTGACSLKIEGRNRGAEYVSKVVGVYRFALNAICAKKFNSKLVEELMRELQQVYNKDFSRGYFVDYPHHERCKVYGSKATQEKVQIGKVVNYYRKSEVAHLSLDKPGLSIGNKICIIGPTTGYVEGVIAEMHQDSPKSVTVKVPSQVRENDKVYLIKKK